MIWLDRLWHVFKYVHIYHIYIYIVQVYVYKCINMICSVFFPKEMCHVTCSISVYRLNFDELKWAYITQHKTRELTPKMCCGSHQAIRPLGVTNPFSLALLEIFTQDFIDMLPSPLDASPTNHQILNFCEQNGRKMNKSPGKFTERLAFPSWLYTKPTGWQPLKNICFAGPEAI